jgi:hypothetical protein
MVVIGLAAVAAAQECERVPLGKLASTATPAVIVLGERKGTLPDLTRARKLVSKLSLRGPVTLAIQAVPADRQDALDALAAGTMSVAQLPSALDWENTWGFPFEAYQPLFELAGPQVRLLAIGQRYEPLPEGTTLPMPPGYMNVLADTMGDSPVPVLLEFPFVSTVSWADHRLAKSATERWSGEGALVILVDRFHVQGGLGVTWQAQLLVNAPVTSQLLASGEGICYPGDRTFPEPFAPVKQLAAGIWERIAE